MRLLASVSPDVTCLMLEAVEGLVTERALVGARQILTGLFLGLLLLLLLQEWSHEAHSGSSH